MQRLMFVGLIVVAISCQFVTDLKDKDALRERCHIPSYANEAEFHGYPSMVGCGQREGLEISGMFKLSTEDADRFERDATAEGWQVLPIPPEVRAKILYRGMKVNLDATDGMFRCHTSGDNVLYATSSRPCAEAGQLSDILLSVYERGARTISAVVRSSY